MAHPLFVRFASKQAIRCVVGSEAKQNDKVCHGLGSNIAQQKQRLDHFMKQNETAKDGPFYEAKLKNKGWAIL